MTIIGSNHLQIPPTPTPDTPTCLTPSALRAIPYISLIVGIDAITPTKAVYAIYDPHIASLRFVHGDGTFVNAERVSFRNTFKDRTPNLNRSQRLHFIELMSRSVQYYHDIREDECFRAKAAREFPSESSVSFSPILSSERCSMSSAIWDNGSSQLLDQSFSLSCAIFRKAQTAQL
jgi:hypothetical protein